MKRLTFAVLPVMLICGVAAGQDYKTWKEASDAGLKKFAKRDYKAAEQDFLKAVDLAEAGGEKSSAQVRVVYCRYNRKDYEGARAAARKVTEILGASSGHLVDAYLYIGHAWYRDPKDRDLRKAREAYAAALEIPDIAPSRRAIAQIHIGNCFYNDPENRDYEQALVAYKKVAEIPGVKEAYKLDAARWVGRCLYNLKKYEEAIAAMQVVVHAEKASDNLKADALRHIGWSQRAQKQYEASNQTFARIRELPKVAPYYKGLAHYETGRNHIYAKQYEEARKALAEVIAMQDVKGVHPDHVMMSHVYTGDCFQAEGNKADAKAAYEKSLTVEGARKQYVDRARRQIKALEAATAE